MEKYTLYISNTYVSKNSLQEHIEKALMKDYHLVIFNELPVLKKKLKTTTEVLNNIYNRCKPIEISFFEFTTNDLDILVQGIPNINASILKLREVENG